MNLVRAILIANMVVAMLLAMLFAIYHYHIRAADVSQEMVITTSQVNLTSGRAVRVCEIKGPNHLILLGDHSTVTVNGKTYTSADCQAAAQKQDPGLAALIEGAQAPSSSEAN